MVKYTENIQGNIINENTSIVDSMARIDEQEIKVLFVVDEDNRLVGSLTDGDIRRAILKGMPLDNRVKNIINSNPIVIDGFESTENIKKVLEENSIRAVPVTDINRTVCGIYYFSDIKVKTRDRLNTPVVIMAGGKGTRLYPYTKILPKPLIPIVDTPICERIIRLFIEDGCDSFFLVVNYKKNMIKTYFADVDLKCNIEFIDEEKPLGTGGGLKLLNDKLKRTFVLTNCDILVLEDIRTILEHHSRENNDVTMVCSMKQFEIPYGTVEFSEGGELISFREKPSTNYFINTGLYVIEPSVMEYIGDNEEIGMPDIIDRMRIHGKKIGIFPISENMWLDMGQFDSLEGMERRLRLLSEY